MGALPQPLAAPPYVIEPMLDGDLDAVMEIEGLSFRAPWSRQVFQEERQRSWAFIDVLRWTQDGRVAAFCNYWRVADEVHILKVATHPDARRLGFGSRLLEHILTFARQHTCRLITLEVRRSN